MSPEELARREARAARTDWIISETEEGYRIYSPQSRSRPYVVTGLPDEPACTCPDFEHHAADPGWCCKHILAVQHHLESREPVSESDRRMPERAARASDAQPDGSRVLIKRSVSPDGKIDALSVEVSAPVDGDSSRDAEVRAGHMLALGDRIVDRFLNRNGDRAEPRERPSRHDRSSSGARPSHDQGRAIPAELMTVRGEDGKWGRRLYLTVRTDDGYLRLYGSERQLADYLRDAGAPELADGIEEDAALRVPCRIVTETNEDGYVEITRVLPVGGAGERREVA